MQGDTFDPVRILAELNTVGVRYVVVGDLADERGGSALTTDHLEIVVADDEEDISRLRAGLIALEAEPDGPTEDPHRARFRTRMGRVELVELPADREFAELERRAGHHDVGNGVIVRAASRIVPVAHHTAPGVEFGERPPPETVERTPVRRRIWSRLEPRLERIDDFLSGLGGRSGR